MHATDDHDFSGRRSDAALGYMLGGLSVLAFVVLLHHPVGHGSGPVAVLESIRLQAGMDRIVHAGLAMIFGLLTAAMGVFSARLGLHRFPVILGLVAFTCGFVLMLLATITDGFVIPAIAAHCAADASAACVSEALTLLRLSAIQIEFLTRFSLFGIGVAVVAWSAALLAAHGVPRWAGFLGMVSGVGQLAFLLSAPDRLTAASLLPVLGAQIVWFLLGGVLFIFAVGPFAAKTKASA